MINSFEYAKYASLVKTKIVEDNDEYVYKQQFLKIKQIEKVEKKDFLELIYALEYLNTISFVHGDINRKNIIYTSDGFKIIDYEPSLLQMKNNKEQLMITIPYVLESELKSKTITSLTDKIGFFYFILRVQKAFSSMNVVELSKHLNHQKFINLNFLSELSYSDILDEAYKVIREKNG